ncbi:hypothetical protein MTO96_001917 [Rhipicephalus appendiculatus]
MQRSIYFRVSVLATASLQELGGGPCRVHLLRPRRSVVCVHRVQAPTSAPSGSVRVVGKLESQAGFGRFGSGRASRHAEVQEAAGPLLLLEHGGVAA